MSETTLTFGCIIRWNDGRGGEHIVSVSNCATWSDARSRAIAEATRMGWTAPRWWQWWRWKDTRV